MICTRCGESMRMTEKDTSSGRDVREYLCPGCGYSDWEDSGPALWQILSDDREEFEAAKARQTPPAPQQPPPISLGRRLLALFRKAG
jgi:ribosomal protein S27AE